MFWISSALCGSDSPEGRYGNSLCWTSELARIGAMISGVNTLAKSTTERQKREVNIKTAADIHYVKV